MNKEQQAAPVGAPASPHIRAMAQAVIQQLSEPFPREELDLDAVGLLCRILVGGYIEGATPPAVQPEPTPDMIRAGWDLLPSAAGQPWDWGASKARAVYLAMRAVAPAPTPPAVQAPLTPDQRADLCEKWLQDGGASNIVDAYESGFIAAELHHGIGAAAQGGEHV